MVAGPPVALHDGHLAGVSGCMAIGGRPKQVARAAMVTGAMRCPWKGGAGIESGAACRGA